MAGVVLGHYVLHEHPAVTGFPLPLIRELVAGLQRIEQLVLEDTHKAVTEPMYTVVMIEGVLLLALAKAGADTISLVQYFVGPDLCYDCLHGTVVVTRPAEVITLAVCGGYVTVEICSGATDDVGELVAIGLYELAFVIFVLELGESHFDARTADQTFVALLVAGVVVHRSTGTIYNRLACRSLCYLGIRKVDKGRLENDDTE